MKFYVHEEIDPNDTDAEWQSAARQGNAYAAYLAEVRERLPQPLRYIAERINFGDYLLEELNVDLESSAATLQIGGETITFLSEEKTFRLRFGGVTRCAVTNAGEHEVSIANSLEGANHEVEVIEPNLFEFRLLFHGGAEIAIRFREFVYEIVPDKDGAGLSPEFAEEVAGVIGEARRGKLDIGVLRDIFAKVKVAGIRQPSLNHYRLGKLALDGKYYALAAEQFHTSLTFAPDHTPTRFLLAKTLYLAGDYVGATPLLDAILRENQKHPGALRYRALVNSGTPP